MSLSRPASSDEERPEAAPGSDPSPIATTQTNAITWSSPDDPANPQNWTRARKATITAVWIYGNLVTTIASRYFEEFGVSSTVATLGISIFLLGYAVGPPLWGPLSERLGRRLPMLAGMTLFTLSTIPSATGRNIETILIGRFFQGTFGSAPLSLVGGGVVDIYAPSHRGVAIACCIGSIFGSPMIAPIMGDYIVMNRSLGWRWTQWLSSIMGGSCVGLVLVLLPETLSTQILRVKSKRLCGKEQSGSEPVEHQPTDRMSSVYSYVQTYLMRPFKLLVTEPILVLVTIYQAFIYGILYLVFVSYPIAFREVRGWSPGISSLPLLGMFIGVVLGAVSVIWYIRTQVPKAMRRNSGQYVPEMHLPAMIVGGCILPVGLFIFAWTSSPHIHWSGMVIGSIPVGYGMFVIFVQCINYIVVCYSSITNSAVAANTLIRSLFGAGFPLFAPYMYHGLGVDWATSVLGFVSIALVPIPVIFYVYGARVRSWSKNTVAVS